MEIRIELKLRRRDYGYVIVGDEALSLKTYLLRPYPGSQTSDDDQKRPFNSRLSRARRLVENAFGIF